MWSKEAIAEMQAMEAAQRRAFYTSVIKSVANGIWNRGRTVEQIQSEQAAAIADSK